MSPTDHHGGSPPEDRPPTEQPIQDGPAASEDSALDPMLDEYTEVSRLARPAGSSVESSPQTVEDNSAEIARGEPSDEGHHTG
ncbi:hypothetical protein GCM10011374_38160 [Kocuria dechangensis]|uniref:Uncharacterized protein n=1 Tax=Kocuria dechangensis TaxID=1176249 RepID=A0A917H7H9_9MICC|nr:hypothetical protein [Kocuria dechangensis]GGG70008.1 hypothetical protein GCM10011374_38160 [Kocuria dechangensis]